ncbi:MAG: TolC family protein [Candidatus Cryptobacteroides sp.]
MKRLIIIMMAAWMAGSCGIWRKFQEPGPDGDISLLFGEEYMTEDSTSVADLGWRELFTDPMLAALIEKGLESNTDVQTARLHTEQAWLSLKSARLAYIPSFNFAPEGSISSFDNFNGVKSGAVKTYTAPVAASWTIDVFGSITNRKRSGKETWMMMQAYEQAAETGLIAAIACQYYTLLMLDRQLELAGRTAMKFQKSVEVLEAMKEAGMANETAIAQMKGAYWQVVAGKESISQALKEVENSLCSTLGETPHSIVRGNVDDVSFPSELKTGVPVAVLGRRPDIRASMHNLANAYYAVNIARASMLPSLTLSGAAGWTNNAGTVVNPGGLILSAAGSLLQPIFNARANATKVKIAKSQQEEAMLSYRQTVLDAGAEVNNALTLYQSASRRIEARQNQVKALEEAVEKTEYLMRYSSTTYLEVLTAQQSLLSAQTSLVEDQYDQIYSIISLYSALGGR